MKRFVAPLVLAACLAAAFVSNAYANDAKQNKAEGKTTSILFIGNSYTYFNSLNGMVEDMLNVAGYPAKTTLSAPGGWRFRQHFKGEVPAKKPETIPTPENIKKEQWDYVVLQEQSCGAVDQRVEFLEYGKKLNDMIKENCPTTKVLLYQTWGRCDGMFEGYGDDDARKAEVLAAFEKRYSKPNDETIEALKDGMQGGYARLAKEIDATVVPVGKAFQTVGDKIDLHADEKDAKPHHPNPNGTYLAACLFFKEITGESPVGLWKKLNEVEKTHKVGQAEAEELEKIAESVVR